MKTKHTYSLLVNSEEKNRSVFETAVYGLLFASMTFSVFAFASQSVTMPSPNSKGAATEIASTPAPQPPLIASR